MKYYRVEPSYKKSFVEIDIFNRKDEDGNIIYLRRELGWRWGSFLFTIPETDEEIQDYIKNQGYEKFEDWAGDYGHAEINDDNEYYLPEGVTPAQVIHDALLPSEDDDFVDVTEDYPNAELIDSWDGCWEDWSVNSYKVTIEDEQAELWCEEAEAAYSEDYQEGVIELGWDFVDTFFEIQCNPKVTPCDENGYVEGEDE